MFQDEEKARPAPSAKDYVRSINERFAGTVSRNNILYCAYMSLKGF